MSIMPGTKVKNNSPTNNEDPRFTELVDEAPKREVFVQDSNGQWVGTGMLMLSDNTLLAPEGFGAESGSVKFGDLINLSEASGYLAIYNYLEQSQYQMVDYHVPKDTATSKPSYVWLYEAQNEFVAQAVTSTQLNANPLVFSYTTTLQSRVNAIKFRAYSPMTNVRIKITDTTVGVVVKYYPSKGSWNGDSSGVDFIVGDNLVDFGDSPLLFSPGTTLQYEITADAVTISGNASGVPYLSGMLQRGTTITLADMNDIASLQASQFSGNYNDLSNKPLVPTNTNQLTNGSGYVTSAQAASASPVQSVNGQTGNVTIPVTAAQVNSDWNSVSGVSQILNKPSLFSGAYSDLSGKPTLFSGSYTDLTNKPALFDGTYTSLTGKPTTFTPSAHTHVISDITGLQSALDGKISNGASIPYVTLTGTPTIPSNTNQLTNGSGFITSAQSPVQSVNGQTGVVSLTIPAAQIQSDWNQSVTTALDYIKNKPSIPVVNYPVTSVNSKTGAVVLSNTDVGAAATIHTHVIADVTNLQTTLNGKFATPTGSTTQYLRGDGSIATFPTIPTVPTLVSSFTNDAGYLTSVSSSQITTALGFTPYNSTNPSAYVNQAGARTAVSLTTTGTSGAATYNSTTGVLNVPQYTSATPVQAASTRALNTAFQISTTRNALVMYSVQITVTASITGGQNGDVILEIASDSGFTSNVQTVSIAGVGQVYTLAIALQGVQPQTSVVSGFVPAGYYSRLRTVNNTGTPTFAYRSGQEILL